jgi:hypothetical protein
MAAPIYWPTNLRVERTNLHDWTVVAAVAYLECGDHWWVGEHVARMTLDASVCLQRGGDSVARRAVEHVTEEVMGAGLREMRRALAEEMVAWYSSSQFHHWR